MSELLVCQNLTKRYGANIALKNVNLTLESGKIYGLLGPNGSGKTTLIKIINGLLTPNEGKVRILGDAPGVETKKIVSYLPDNSYLNSWMRVEQIVDMFCDFYDDFSAEKAYAMLSGLGIDKKVPLKNLSKGNKEKVCLILVMSRDARLYVLDEPIAGVDPATRDYIISTIINNYNPEASVILSTHLISDIEQVLDEVIFIQNGEIVLKKIRRRDTRRERKERRRTVQGGLQMVKKLFKYDFWAVAKIMLPIEIVLIGVATLYRILQIFENDSVAYRILNASTATILAISIAGSFVLTFILSIIRFYKNLYTAEGYLTFTLPVKPSSHIMSKLLVSILFDVIAIVASLAALSIATAGDVFAEIVKAAAYLAKDYFRATGVNGAFYIVEVVLAVFFALVAEHLLVYLCISIGQLVNRKKMLLAVGVYFGFYMVRQIIGTLFIIFGVTFDFAETIADIFARYPYGALHGLFIIVAAVEILLGTVYFLVSKQIIKKRLNLE